MTITKVTRKEFEKMFIDKTINNFERLIIDNGDAPPELYVGDDKSISRWRNHIHVTKYVILNRVVMGMGFRNYYQEHPEFKQCKEALINAGI